jgi:hypothetical protein
MTKEPLNSKKNKTANFVNHDDRETSTDEGNGTKEKKIKKGREGKKKLITFPADYTPNTTAGAETSLRRASAVSLLPRAHARAPGVAAGSRADRTRT